MFRIEKYPLNCIRSSKSHLSLQLGEIKSNEPNFLRSLIELLNYNMEET